MARTQGSGWGGGVILYQICPLCGKKKALFAPVPGAEYYKPFKCTAKNCKDAFGSKNRFNSDILLRFTYRSQSKK